MHKHIRKAAPRMSVRVVPSAQALEMLRERIESTDDINAIDAAAASPLCGVSAVALKADVKLILSGNSDSVVMGQQEIPALQKTNSEGDPSAFARCGHGCLSWRAARRLCATDGSLFSQIFAQSEMFDFHGGKPPLGGTHVQKRQGVCKYRCALVGWNHGNARSPCC
jgi:hypothetical protein